MALFHQTLKDAKKALSSGNYNGALEILKKHQESEAREEPYITHSLYYLKVFLQNYILHLSNAIELIERDPEAGKEAAVENINACMTNIDAFEDGIKKLTERERSFLE